MHRTDTYSTLDKQDIQSLDQNAVTAAEADLCRCPEKGFETKY